MGFCDVFQACLKRPTTNLNLNVGDTYEHAFSWSQEAAEQFKFCASGTASIYPEYRQQGSPTWIVMNADTSNPLSTSTGVPQTSGSCGDDTACASCPEDGFFTVKANAAGDGKTYEITVRAVSDDTSHEKRDGGPTRTVTIGAAAAPKAPSTSLMGVGG